MEVASSEGLSESEGREKEKKTLAIRSWDGRYNSFLSSDITHCSKVFYLFIDAIKIRIAYQRPVVGMKEHVLWQPLVSASEKKQTNQ